MREKVEQTRTYELFELGEGIDVCNHGVCCGFGLWIDMLGYNIQSAGRTLLIRRSSGRG